jgi:hypothetical protein
MENTSKPAFFHQQAFNASIEQDSIKKWTEF